MLRVMQQAVSGCGCGGCGESGSVCVFCCLLSLLLCCDGCGMVLECSFGVMIVFYSSFSFLLLFLFVCCGRVFHFYMLLD